MKFRRWVVFTFLIHVLVVIIDKGGGLVLYLLTKNVPQEHGRAGILASLPFILMALANLGLATSLVYLVRRGRYTPQQAFETTTLVALVWGGLIGLLSALVALHVLPLLRSDWLFDPMVVWPICIAVPLLLVSSYGNSIQLATEQVKRYGAMHLMNSLVFLPAFFLCFWWFGGDASGGDVPLGVAWGRLITAGLVALVTLWLVRKVVRLRLRLHREFLRDSLQFGWRANIISTLTYLNHRIDLLVLAAVFVAPAQLTGQAAKDAIAQQVAFYSMAVTWAELVWHFPEAMRDLFFSKVAGSSHAQARELTPVLTRLSLLVSLLAGAVLLLLINPVMGAITWLVTAEGNPWFEVWSAPVGGALLLLVPGTVAFTVSKVLQADLAARNRMQPCVNAQAMVLAIMLALDVVLIPDMGAAGAAIASTAAYVAATVYTLRAYTRDARVTVWACLVMHRSDLGYLREILASIWNKLRRRTA
jgi:O-antigen/teichoic acid export membrane protein